ncbi:DUF1097 domain-containing protein [Clostridium septicum]|uniref:DUF1097 domain-containing protein n=1 Tax=Clostridium septicum TaxID=1504 RepID=UPI003217F609
MSEIFTLSLMTAILCFGWALGCDFTGLIGFAGFAGCTTFFAAGGRKEGFKTAIFTNVSGIFWAVIIIKLSVLLNISHAGAIMTGIVTFAMCYQSRIKYFTFIPGTFMGCFTTCAANGNWQSVLPSMVFGTVLGVLCESTGKRLYEKLSKKEC